LLNSLKINQDDINFEIKLDLKKIKDIFIEKITKFEVRRKKDDVT
jgi:hypothetical protein